MTGDHCWVQPGHWCSLYTGALYTLASGAENGEIRCRHCDQTNLYLWPPPTLGLNLVTGNHKETVEQCAGDMQCCCLTVVSVTRADTATICIYTPRENVIISAHPVLSPVPTLGNCNKDNSGVKVFRLVSTVS